MERDAEREHKRRSKLAAVIQESHYHLNSKTGLSNAAQVVSSVKEKFDLDVKPDYVRKVLRADLNQRYRRIKKVPFLGNTVRCLILRQMYAKFMIP